MTTVREMLQAAAPARWERDRWIDPAEPKWAQFDPELGYQSPPAGGSLSPPSPPIKNPLLTRYWIEFEPPDPPEQYHRCWPPGQCGVTAYSLEDALGLIREHVFLDSPVPRARRVREGVDLSTDELDPGAGRWMGAPVWRSVCYPFAGYNCWRRDVRSWLTNPSMPHV
jgi:hypothetical protein